ncbi:MAG: acyl-CoA thioesterase [Candidatus Marinimicrobia bacterium]|jgi:acyl-CoA thioesterase YciA|nr:acyl-CoA thioesterase [Candidatus Neomarinimicrobiota bacterium]MBT4154398.1 acyl-CoA thioesterase [Candidatus Neomarinimicrobiota bacterium]MBT4554132.1 acyl-CoA thioesterase [Candidatus Neomarinimicrobiota bacterium]MBT5115895.1 acyl-CoA thioesterase [Candidatus Neomarinimicrobiota bacterium]MBT5748190.1 acyl-CoA thioesterase [Candidatus Neomarinimicrobiota bacterium]
MKITRYSQLVMPQDANVVGTLFGGQMVSWMDIAVAKAAHRFLKGTEAEAAVTRAIDSIEFEKPVYVGNWVNFESRIIKTGHSSIVIQVDAFKESHEEDNILACTAIFTMVSVKKSSDGSYQKVNHNKSI